MFSILPYWPGGQGEFVVFFVQGNLAVDVLPGEGVVVFLHGAAGEVEAGLYVAAPADVAADIEEEAFGEVGVKLFGVGYDVDFAVDAVAGQGAVDGVVAPDGDFVAGLAGVEYEVALPLGAARQDAQIGLGLEIGQAEGALHELGGVGFVGELLVGIEAAADGCPTEHEEAGNAADEGFVHDGLSRWCWRRGF